MVSMISPVGALAASAATYDDRQGPINLTPISESEGPTAAGSSLFQEIRSVRSAPDRGAGGSEGGIFLANSVVVASRLHSRVVGKHCHSPLRDVSH